MIKIFLLLLFIMTTNTNATEFQEYIGPIKNPTIYLQDLNGNTHTLDQYNGSIVLVQFWATYCPPCIKEMPSMNNLQNKLKKAGIPFKILAINMAETKVEVEKFVKIVKPEFSILMNEDGSSVQKWRVFAAPSNFLINKQGKISYTLFGGVKWDAGAIIDTIIQLSKS